MFREVLEFVKRSAEGVVAVCIAGSDGIPVEVVENGGDLNLSAEVISAEMTSILRGVNEFFNTVQGGVPEEMLIKTNKYAVVVRLINSEYFAMALLHSSGNVGKARFLLKKAVERVRKEF